MSASLAPRTGLPGDLQAQGYVLPPDPTYDEWRDVLAIAENIEAASPWHRDQIENVVKLGHEVAPAVLVTPRSAAARRLPVTHIDPSTLSPLPTAEAWWHRFVTKFAVADDGCWIWQAYVGRSGYGRFGIKNRVYTAHRVAYMALIGPLPSSGLVLDHVCHNRDATCPSDDSCRHRRCVNPWHMEVVTSVENVMRGHSIMARRARATTCKHGHELTGRNLYVAANVRHCKTCRREANRRRYARVGPPPAKPSSSQRRVMEVIRAGGILRQLDWQHFVLCAPGTGAVVCRVSTGTPASIVKRGWATRPEPCRLLLTADGVRVIGDVPV